MSRRNEDSIERLFRKVVLRHDTTFEEGDWTKMEAMLDRDARERAAIRSKRVRRGVYTVAGLIGVVTAVYFLSSGDLSNADSDLAKSIDRSTVSSNGSPKPWQAADHAQHPRNGQKNDNSSAALLNSKTPITTKEDHRQSEQQSVSPTIKSNSRQKSFQGDNNRTDQRSLQAVTTSAESEHQKGSMYRAYEQSAVNDRHTSAVQDFFPRGLMAVKGNQIQKMKEEQLLEKQLVVQEEIKESKSEKNGAAEKSLNTWRLSGSLIAAPDFSTTSLNRYSSPGGAYGVMIGYQVFNRFYVHTGYIRAAKRYSGYGAEYQPPDGYWENRTNGVVPDRVDGSCTIAEVPINLRYDVLSSVKRRVFVSAGVSSYLMMDEAYKYQFNSYNPGAAYGWQSQENQSYMFSIGNFSVGYERLIHPKIAIGIEPYLKVPFSKMGWSNIDLYSTGAYVTLRYRLMSRTVPAGNGF
ncbi:MAG: hypothetical protein ACOYXT_04670 [Bacteroidota bacterium]